MTPDQVSEVLGATVTTSYDEWVVDVSLPDWVATVTAARDVLDFRLFDLLTAVDLQDDGFQVVLRLWSVQERCGLRLRTQCSRVAASVPSLSGVFAGADWHERQTAELFGIAFAGHPRPARLLLSEAALDHPLRKDVVLAARLGAWPGVKEPGETTADEAARPRRKHRPLGVPTERPAR